MRAWWFFVLKGMLLIAAGLFFMFRPEMAIKGISFYIGLILVTGGVVAVWNIHRLRAGMFSKVIYLGPITAFIAGVILLFYTEYALTIFGLAIGLWLFIDGIDQLRSVDELSKFNKGMGRLLLLMGLFSVVIAVYIFIDPYQLIKVMTVTFGIVMLLSGGFSFALGLNLRK